MLESCRPIKIRTQLSLFFEWKNFDPASPRSRKDPKPGSRRLLALIVLIALALSVLRVTVAPNFEGLMDADHRHCWEQGNVAEALLAGRGFGSALMSNQSSAMYAAGFSGYCCRLLITSSAFTRPRPSLRFTPSIAYLSALACIPIFLMARRSFGERAAWWAAWGWAFSPYGIYFAAAWAWSTHLLLLCLCWLLVLAQHMEQISAACLVGWIWPSRGLCGAHRAIGADCDSISAGARLLAAFPRRQTLVPAGHAWPVW